LFGEEDDTTRFQTIAAKPVVEAVLLRPKTLSQINYCCAPEAG
jgi:hypothetical protein